MTLFAKPPASTIPRTLKERDDALDGVRGIACLMVFFYHTATELRLYPFKIHGFTGVMIFFVLSGYLMFAPFLGTMFGERPFPDMKRYAVRRFTRIYPPYLVCLILFSAVRYVTNFKPPTLSNFLTHVVLIFNYLDPADFFSINGVFWSLAIEAQFYIILPIAIWLVTLLVRKRGATGAWVVILLFFVVGLLSRWLEFRWATRPTTPKSFVFFTTLFSYLDLFAAGMLLALAERLSIERLRDSLTRRWGIVIVGVVAFLVANYWTSAVATGNWLNSTDMLFTVFNPLFTSLAVAVALLALLTRPLETKSIFSWQPLVWLGTISYSLYLYHILIQYGINLKLKLDHNSLRGYGPWVFGLVSLPPSLIVSYVMYVLVERPSMRWGARYSQHHMVVQPQANEPVLSTMSPEEPTRRS